MSWDFLKRKTGKISAKCPNIRLYLKILSAASKFNYFEDTVNKNSNKILIDLVIKPAL